MLQWKDFASIAELESKGLKGRQTKFLHLLHFREPHLDGPAGMLDGGDGRGACATIVARDLDDICAGLGHAARDRADAGLRDQLHRHLGLGRHLQGWPDSPDHILSAR